MPGELVRLTSASSGPEAEMITGLLQNAGIRALIQRTAAFDVPDFLAGGPREVFVRSRITPAQPSSSRATSACTEPR